MSQPPPSTGNPVFDYKAGFRATAQSAQRILFYSALPLFAAGIVGRVVTLHDRALNLTLRFAPLMGLALVVASAAWGYWWRDKLRRDFQRAYSER